MRETGRSIRKQPPGAAADARARHSNDNNDNNNGHNDTLYFPSHRSACCTSIVRSISKFSFHVDQQLVDTWSPIMSWQKQKTKKKGGEQSDSEGGGAVVKVEGGHLVLSLRSLSGERPGVSTSTR